MRRRWLSMLVTSAALGAALPGLAPVRSSADERVRPPLMNAETRTAIDEGLRFLARTQREDGAWISDAGNKVNEDYVVPDGQRNVPHVGVTALGILAFLAAGHVPGRGPYGAQMERAVHFLLQHVENDGFIGAHGTRMYSHAFATLALAEVCGSSTAPDLRKKLESAVELTVKCQNATGAWRYVPFTIESDMSVTVCQVVALRAARNVGIRVPQETIDAAVRYVIDSAITEPVFGGAGDDQIGAFYYQPSNTRWNRSSFSLTAAGLTTLFQAGIYDDKQVEEWARAHGVRKRTRLPRVADTVAFMKNSYASVPRDHFFFYYGNYYAAQAMYNVGAYDPAAWESWYSRVRGDLLSRSMRQQGKGPSGEAESRWDSNIGTNGAFATAVAILILSMPFDYLPIHQK